MPNLAASTPGRPIGPPTQEEIAVLWTIAEQAAASRLYKAGKEIANVHQLFMKLLYARDLGIGVTAALSGVDIVRGKLELSAALQAALVRAHPDYDYDVVDVTEQSCSITFTRDGVALATSTFTMADAQKAGLTAPSADGEPGNYDKYPRNMLWSRAMSNGTGWYCPDVANGLRLYGEGELDGSAGETDAAAPEVMVLASALDDTPANGDSATPTNGSLNGHAPAAPAGGPIAGAQTPPAGAGPAITVDADPHGRATRKDRIAIKELAEQAGLDSAQLFNLLVVAGGGTRLQDTSRAASLLDAALERLPEHLVAPVIAELEASIASQVTQPAAAMGLPPAIGGAVNLDFAAITPATRAA